MELNEIMKMEIGRGVLFLFYKVPLLSVPDFGLRGCLFTYPYLLNSNQFSFQISATNAQHFTKLGDVVSAAR